MKQPLIDPHIYENPYGKTLHCGTSLIMADHIYRSADDGGVYQVQQGIVAD